QARAACLDVDVILWLVEADRPVDRDPLIPKLLEKSKKPVLLIINKIDVVPKEQLLPIIDSYRKICPFASILPISAL
ncbi:MAG: GTPase Era, partial [Gammaproteobacteria bacterium]|nr:GTPase Era [Gammaproteobacteria bacterium]NIR95005.1 GTPase Era [Gammaproteobacteria bacterium]NIW41717.1 GTPase Era [candidate division Zixibacteria bacterium]